MERLTKRNEHDTSYFIPQCFEICDGMGCSEQCNDCHVEESLIEKLGAYEDLEEQGLLLRLQVKPGDTIYQPIGKDINDYKVIGLCYNMAEKEWLYELAIQIGVDWLKTSCPMDCIGKTVFLTKEEAEQKLESMKGE